MPHCKGGNWFPPYGGTRLPKSICCCFWGNGFVSRIGHRDNNRGLSRPSPSLKDLLLEGDRKGYLLNRSENDIGMGFVKSNQSNGFQIYQRY